MEPNASVDLWGLNARLADAQSNPSLARWNKDSMAAGDSQDAVYQLLVSYGMFRLFQLTPEDQEDRELLEQRFAEEVLVAGINGAIRAAKSIMQLVQELEEQIAAVDDSLEAMEISIGVLESRLDLFAFCAAWNAQESGDRWNELLNFYLQGDLVDLDAQLENVASLLSIADQTYWVANLRSLMPAESFDPIPWWLTDTMGDLRIADQDLCASFDEADDRFVARLTRSSSGPGVESLDATKRSAEESWSLAASEAADRIAESIASFDGTLNATGESFDLDLMSPESIAGIGAWTDTFRLALVLSVSVERNSLRTADELPESQRVYRCRWGTRWADITVLNESKGESPDVLYRGTASGVEWKKVRPLVLANHKDDLHIRRIL